MEMGWDRVRGMGDVVAQRLIVHFHPRPPPIPLQAFQLLVQKHSLISQSVWKQKVSLTASEY